MKEMKSFNDESLRTIAIAYKDITKEQFDNFESSERDADGVYTFEKSEFILVGMAGIKDTLKKGVPQAVLNCNSAGITVIMVTGDNKATAVAIAKESNILSKDAKGDGYSVMTGQELWEACGGIICLNCKERQELESRSGNKKLSDNKDKCPCPKNKKQAKKEGKDESSVRRESIGNKEVFKQIIKELRVVARSRPLDKYLLVFGLKEEENIVAVTGDGTNDAPALSKSSVGFAMNAGTDIAKNASDIIIIDNNFASIVTAVLWGRNIYDSIRKFIQFQLTVNIAACALVFITACIGNETPLTAIQMLWVNIIMDSLASLALATENPDQKLLKRKPYGKGEYIINFKMWKHLLCQSIFLLALLLFLYIQGSKFIQEDDPVRMAEISVIQHCYGDVPGHNPDTMMYIIDGSSGNWSPSIKILPGLGVEECGMYYGATLSDAFKIYTNKYGSTAHMTIVFNVFVLYVLFNQINSRFIEDELNILYRIVYNPLFIAITIIEIGLQALLIQFGSIAFRVASGGLTAHQWGICIGFASIVFVINLLLKLIPIDIWMEKVFNAVKCRNKVADPNIENVPVRDVEMSNHRPNAVLNEPAPADNMNNSRAMEKKNVSDRHKTSINEFLRKPSRTNTLTRIGSKNFYRGKNDENNNN
jgi:Ca2+ transporting ATPase